MSGRIQQYLSSGTALVIVFFLAASVYVVFWPPGAVRGFAAEPLRGMSVVVKGREYPLSFHQQQRILSYLQRAVAFDGAVSEQRGLAPPIEKIVFHRFKGRSWELEPLGWQEQKMIFRSPETEQTLIDASNGHLFSLLVTTYD